MAAKHQILVTGGTGYLGRELIPHLITRGHGVRALVRAASVAKLPRGAEPIIGDPLGIPSIQNALSGCDTVVHLVGVPKPSPLKAAQFRTVDFASIEATARAVHAASRPIHVVYVSVAHPAPVMRAYVAVRQEAEALLRSLRLPTTVLRPWYVLGPGHRWPVVLMPIYKLLGAIPATRASAARLGFVTVSQMVAALVTAVERGATETPRIVEVPEVRRAVL